MHHIKLAVILIAWCVSYGVLENSMKDLRHYQRQKSVYSEAAWYEEYIGITDEP